MKLTILMGLLILLLVGCNKQPINNQEYYLTVINGEDFELKEGDLVYINHAKNNYPVAKLINKTSPGIITENILPNQKGQIQLIR